MTNGRALMRARALSGAEEWELDSQPTSGEIGVSAGRVGEPRIRWTPRGLVEACRDRWFRPSEHGWWSDDCGSVIAPRHLDGGDRLTANAMTSRRAAVQTAEHHLTQDVRIGRMLGARLFHGRLIHAVATGPMFGARRRLRTGHSAVSSAKCQPRDQQYQKAKVVGPGPSHCRSMLPKRIAPRQYGAHSIRSRTHYRRTGSALACRATLDPMST